MSWFEEEIAFKRKEFLGLTVFVFIGLIFLIIQFIPKSEERVYDMALDEVLAEKEVIIPKENENQIKSFKQKKLKTKRPTTKKETEKERISNNELFTFNPNKIGKDSIQRLGFKSRVADTWIKFRSKGKHYNNKKDLLSIYGIDSALVHSLDNYIIFDSRKFEEQKPKAKPINKEMPLKKVLPKIDLNTCSEEDLKQLGGIGRIFASRILKYRKLLGGYAKKEQLLNVYGLKDSTFQLIKEHVDVITPPTMIKINTASKKQLSEHFLVDYKAAKLIYAYRSAHGPFVNKNDFELMKGISKQKKDEILPYLSFDL